MDKNCRYRHPRMCKFLLNFGRCKFGVHCSYNHQFFLQSIDNDEKELSRLKHEISILEKKVTEPELTLHGVVNDTAFVMKNL